MITKEMLKRCQNESKQAFCALPDDVQNLIKAHHKYRECLWHIGNGVCSWKQDNHIDGSPHRPWRLSPDTPTEPEWEEFSVGKLQGAYCINSGDFDISLWKSSVTAISVAAASAMVNFLGIIYVKDGIETMRTSVDAAFGVPVRVRFAKESK